MNITVYVAGAYTGSEAANVMKALKAADQVMELGVYPFIPHLFHFWHQLTPRDYRAWMKLDEHYLLKSDIIWKISDSPGVKEEVEKAHIYQIPVVTTFQELEVRVEQTKKEMAEKQMAQAFPCPICNRQMTKIQNRMPAQPTINLYQCPHCRDQFNRTTLAVPKTIINS